MTERRAMEPFETRLAGRVRAYTDRGDRAPHRRARDLAHRDVVRSARPAGRRVGARRLARSALRRRSLGGGRRGRRPHQRGRRRRPRATVATPASARSRRPRHRRRPVPRRRPAGRSPTSFAMHGSGRAVMPGLDQWGTGFLSLASGPSDFGPEPGAGASRSAIAAAGPDTLAVTATAETQGCAVGDVGTYRWSLEGKGTVLTLTAVGPDACAAREAALAGHWVRADLRLPR